MEQRRTEQSAVESGGLAAISFLGENMDRFYEKYADAILNASLAIGRGDVLSINSEEGEDLPFAKLLARKAKEISGNGSYIQRLENGKITENFDYLSPFPLKKNPTCFVYIPIFSPFPEIKGKEELDAPRLQEFRLLSDPLGNSLPTLPFVTCPLPSKAWDEMMEESATSSLSLLYNVLGLEDDDYISSLIRRHENLTYQASKLNESTLGEGRITNDEGTDLTFSFLPSSRFTPSYLTTTGGRHFSPSVISADIFRLISPTTLSGWLNISKPIVLFGKRIRNLSLRFEGGRVVEYIGGKEAEELMALYLSQEPTAGRASMLSLSDIYNPLEDEDVTYITDWDRMRTPSITIGGPKGEAVADGNEDKTVDSLLSLTLPFGSESTTIVALDKNGEERTIYSGGYIIEEE